MITEAQLKTVLSENLSPEEVDIFLEKRLKTLYAIGNIDNINEIIKVLKKYNLLFLLNKCPTILALGNSKEISTILDILEGNNLKDLVSQCPSILAHGNSKEIGAILDILEKNNLKDLVSQCPSILAQGNSKEIKSVLLKIEKINGNIKKLSPNLLINYSKLCEIIDLNKGSLSNKEYYKNIRFHLLLIDKYNQIYTKEELTDLASLLNISYDTLLSVICFDDIKLANTILEKQNYLWVGNNIPIRKEDFTFYQNQILDIVNLVTKSFMKKYSFFEYDDVYDFVLDSLMNKCGAFFINYGKTEKLRPFLFHYLKLTCKGLLGSTKIVEFEKINNIQEYSYQEDNEVNQFIQNYFYLSAEEQYFLLEMSKGIEGGYDYIEYLMEKFFLTKKEVIEKITDIREKIASHNNGLEDDSYQKTI